MNSDVKRDRVDEFSGSKANESSNSSFWRGLVIQADLKVPLEEGAIIHWS